MRVDMVYNQLSTRAKHVLDLVSMLIGAGIAILFIKYSIGYVETSWALLEGSPDPGGLPGRFILKATIPAGFALFALQCLANAIRHLDALLPKDGRAAP